MRTWFGAVLLCAAAGAVGGAGLAADPVVMQRNRAFDVREVRLPRGASVRFRNDDQFLHQVYVDAPSFRFVSAEQGPGSTLDVKFPVAGQFTVRCEIHPKMALGVTVE